MSLMPPPLVSRWSILGASAASLLALSLGVAFEVSAQDPPPGATFTERVDVDLVQVEVMVTDSDGKPVPGLGQDDFQVRYGGKKVDLSLFSEVRLQDETEPSRANGPPAEQPTFVVLLVDHEHLDGGLPDDSLDAVGRFVSGLGPAGRAMVLSAEGDELEVVQPFTADAAAVTGALRGLDLRPSPSSAAQEFRRLKAEITRVADRTGASGPSAGGGDNLTLSTDEEPEAVKVQIEGLSQKVYRELAALTLRVDRAITGMAGLPGRKELVLVTGSLPNRVVHELNLAWTRAFGPGSRRASRPSLAESSGGVGRFDNYAAQIGVETANTEQLFDIMSKRANAQGVTLHVLGSVINTDGSDRVDDPALVASVAERTGGRAVIGQNAHRVFDSVSEDLRSYYVLGLTPPGAGNSNDDGAAAEPVEIEVKLARRHKDLDLRYRESVRPRDLEEQATLAAVSALLLGSESRIGDASEAIGELGLQADTPSAVEGRDDVLRLPVTVFIPLRDLTLVVADSGSPEAVHQGRISLFFTTGDLAGGAGPVQKVQLPLQLAPEQLEGKEERKIEYAIDVPMGPEAHRVAVAMRDDLSGSILSASAEIQRLRLTP